jgi:hypothetical protein
MPRFVILEHDFPALHWDFLLEAGAVLRGWRLAAPPRPGAEVAAEPSFDHRLLYLDYEGPVSGGRGRVTRWDAGPFTWQEDRADGVAVLLTGSRVRGQAVLKARTDGSWSFRLEEPGERGASAPRGFADSRG